MAAMTTKSIRQGVSKIAKCMYSSEDDKVDFLPWDLRRLVIAKKLRANSPLQLNERHAAIRYGRNIQVSPTNEDQLGPIWQFWAQGSSDLPPIVQTCLQSVERNSGGRQRIMLSAESVHEYLQIPDSIMDRIPFWGWTKFSNLVRVMLLAQYGGTWIDATVLIEHPIPDWIEQRNFFVFRWPNDPRILATWFIHARARNPLMTAMCAAYQDYWLRAEVPGDYFMFHYIFEVIILANSSLHKLWTDVPVHDAATPHELQSILSQPFNHDMYRTLMERSWIQKLTYKFDSEPCLDTPTFGFKLSVGVPT